MHLWANRRGASAAEQNKRRGLGGGADTITLRATACLSSCLNIWKSIKHIDNGVLCLRVCVYSRLDPSSASALAPFLAAVVRIWIRSRLGFLLPLNGSLVQLMAQSINDGSVPRPLFEFEYESQGSGPREARRTSGPRGTAAGISGQSKAAPRQDIKRIY